MKTSPVPRLDLAPKLKRPLSLWNPLDYLRLLYWVFYFPQALRWYVDVFGGGDSLGEQKNWQQKWQFLRQNTLQLQLVIQGLLLTVITPLTLSGILQEIGVNIDWKAVVLGVVVGIAIGLRFDMVRGVARGVAASVTVGVAGGLVFGMTFGVTLGVTVGMAGGVVFGVVRGLGGGLGFGVVTGVVGGVAVDIAVGVAFNVAFNVAGGLALGVGAGLTFGLASGMAVGIGFSVVAGLVGGLAILRLDNWLIGSPVNFYAIQNGIWLLPRITSLPLPNLAFRCQNWLRQDWEIGLHNVNQLLQYTLQFIPVVTAVNRVLKEQLPEQVIFRVSQLAEKSRNWYLVVFASASLSEYMKWKAIGCFFILPRSWRQRLQERLNSDIRLDTPSRAAAAGFWYLYQRQPEEAVEAFTVVRSLLYGEEMFTLAQTLALFTKAKDITTITSIQVPTFPQEPLLRPLIWQAINSLYRVIEDVRVVKGEVSIAARSLALNRAIGELINILNNASTLPQAESQLIVDITQTWKDSLEGMA